MTTTRSQAGQKRPSAGADIRNFFTPSSAGGQPEDVSEPVRKKVKVDASNTTDGSEQSVLAAPQAGWNGSVGAGLRTTFGASAQLRPEQDQPAAVAPPVESQEEKAADGAPAPGPKSADADADGAITTVNGWILPKGLLSEKLKKKPSRKPGSQDSWEHRLGDWYLALVEHNPDHESLQKTDVVLEVWRQWLEMQDMPPPLRSKCQKLTITDSNLGAKTLRKQMKLLQIEEPKIPHYGWTLPPPVDSANFELPMKDDEPWVERFASWLYEFGKLNSNLPPMDREMEWRVASVYREWIATVKLSRNKTTLACKIPLRAFASQKERLYKALGGEAPSTSAPQPREVIVLSSSSEGEVSEGEQASTPAVTTALPVIPASTEPIKLMSAEEELEYRAAYYPGVLPNEVFCLNCVNHGHTTRECPLLTCRWCTGWGHPYTRCPTRHRCTKCRQIGHEAGTCTEKLALPWDQMDCARCGAKDHLEDACYEVFRSTFNPPPGRIHKVKALPIYCGTCGSEGHYWTECGLNAAWVTEAEKDGLTSASVKECYVDPSCKNVAICYSASTGYQIRGAAAEGRPPHLNGRSIVPQRHVEYFEVDDDDDDEVQITGIQSLPQRPQAQQPGKKSFSSFSSSNNAGGRGGNRGRGGGPPRGGQHNGGGGGFYSGKANPPLPSGPPPSGPKAGRGSRPRPRHGKGGGRGGRGGY
ncbi:hypothetical protein QBC37DRAFT_283158 [Rhypophila decipiens]|uniref:CCHC-type domain-containing protein n=1 Tax=Rhypophila decipiens TaxID=261697 RepID=A0AAN6YA33_9PEZI|nr:hypothetical protein QBC37DRAFT_283158 [Rhypophila decipiens]